MRKNFITIGSFDGIHTGHMHLLGELKTLAEENDMQPLILAFGLPPRVAASEGRHMTVITLPKEKLNLLKSLEIGPVKELKFEKVRDIDRQDFFDILLKKYNMGGLIVGKDFAMGKDRLGNLDFLRKACAKSGVIYAQAEFVQMEGHKISSTTIRKALHDGNIEAVTKMLGRMYQLSGKIIKGKQLGRKIGFPTANMDVDEHKILPLGIYAVEVFLGKEKLKGVASIGFRPTVEKNGLPLTEVYILDFDRDIYGKILTINFVAKIRDEIKFDTLGELTQQINRDAICAYRILK